MGEGPLRGCAPSFYGKSAVISPSQQTTPPIYSSADSNDNFLQDGCVMSVVLGIRLEEESIPLPHVAASIEPLAIVEWGRGDATFRAEMDWLHGQSFSVVASMVTVYAKWLPVLDAFQPDLRLFAAACYGDVPRSRVGPRRTFRQTVGADSAGTIIRIPAHSSTVRVTGNAAALAAGRFVITYFAADGATVLDQDQVVPGEDSLVKGGAYFLSVRNNSIGAVLASTSFGLFL